MRARSRQLAALAVVAAALALGLSACSDDSGDSARSTTTTTTVTSSGPLAGTYLNGSTNAPHYSVVLQTSNGTGIGGTLSYVFQDGTSHPTFTFSGTASGGSGSATPSTGSAFTFTYTPTHLVFANCQSFLSQQPDTCTFTKP